MDVTQIVATTAITSLVSAIVGAAVATTLAFLKEKKRENTDGEKALRDVVKLLAVDKVTYLTQAAVDEGCITIQQRSFIHEMAKSARALGANGETEECDRAVDALPLKHV